MSFLKNNAGLTITGTGLTLVEVTFENDQVFLENMQKADFNEPLDFNSKESHIIAALQESFDEIKSKNEVKSKSLGITLPPDMFHVISVPVESKLVNRDLQEHFRWEFSVLHPNEDPDDYILFDYLSENSDKVIIIAILKSYAKLVQKFCSRNEFKLNFIDLSNIAVNSFIVDNDSANSINLYFDKQTLSISYMKEENLEYLKIIDLDTVFDVKTALLNEINPIIEKSGKEKNDFKINIMGETEIDDLLDQSFEAIINRPDPFTFVIPKVSIEIPESINEKNIFAPAIAAAMRT